jgi:hypothetical protein
LEVETKIRVLVFRDFARLDEVPFEQNILPWLLTQALLLLGTEQGHQTLISHD